MNGLDFAYFHFHVHRVKSGKCICPEGRCIICQLAWEGWPHPHCTHEHGSGLMDTRGNGEFTCHDCGKSWAVGRGLQPQPAGDERAT